MLVDEHARREAEGQPHWRAATRARDQDCAIRGSVGARSGVAMPSNARKSLEANSGDLERLWEIHGHEAGSAPGRKYGVEVLNKAAVVLVCAAWEAYCEDIVGEAIDHIAADCSDPSKLPKELRTAIANRIRAEKHDHAPWELAGDGWRKILKANAADVAKKLTGAWNTPKMAQIKELFGNALGIDDITKSWTWHKNTVATTTKALDEYVALRGEIAHRLKPVDSVHKKDGQSFYDHISRLADKIDDDVRGVLLAATGKTYW
jgi:hypothetical protein